MRRTDLTVGACLAILALATGKLLAADAPATKETHAMSTFKLTSTDLSPGASIAAAQVFNGFGCQGGNVSPALAWSGAPAGTKSFALMVHDPDAPTGSGWWHWVVYNIPAETHALAAGAGRCAEEAAAGRRACRAVPISARPATAARARRRASRTTTLSPVRTQGAKLELPADASAAHDGFQRARPVPGQCRAHRPLWPLGPRERRPAVWPYLVMPLVVLAVFFALLRMHHRLGTTPAAASTPAPAPRRGRPEP